MSSEKWSIQPEKSTPEAGDKGLLIDNVDGVSKQFDIGNLPSDITEIKAWDVSTSYIVGQPVRLFDAETMICNTAHTSSATVFPAGFNADNTKWTPARASL